MTRRTYVYREGQMVDKSTGEPMVRRGSNLPPQAPLIHADTPGYRSPIDGRWIEGRRARRYDLESNNCVEAGDSVNGAGGAKAREFKNERFMKKWGLRND